jgi:hypothetical protein
MQNRSAAPFWPALPYPTWQPTLDTVHMWTQIVGKIRLTRAPAVNHSWHVVLYVTAHGLTTSPIPFGERTIELAFDFHQHVLLLQTSDGIEQRLPLEAVPVADFYQRVLEALATVGSPVRIHARPNEVERAIPFASDREHRTYDGAHMRDFFTALTQADRLMKQFRGEFIGKASPVHFFWGSFDLAVTRFSGRPAPPHPGGIPNLPDAVAREAYSHEVSSAGFWPGGGILPEAVFYSYAYPEPPGFADAAVPEAAYYHPQLREFVLPYEAVRTSAQPDALVMDFLHATYNAAADRAGWDRAALERPSTPLDNRAGLKGKAT